MNSSEEGIDGPGFHGFVHRERINRFQGHFKEMQQGIPLSAAKERRLRTEEKRSPGVENGNAYTMGWNAHNEGVKHAIVEMGCNSTSGKLDGSGV